MASAASPPAARALAPLPSIATNTAITPPSFNSPASSQSLTAKQWVIPPRPKPGRKPATDTPPTKRKAQNRAAQRAFRERRAAKVGELEEQMDEMVNEHDTTVDSLRSEISSLEQRFEQQLRERINTYESEIRGLENEITMWRERFQGFESILGDERRRREILEGELAIAKGEAIRLPSRLSRVDESQADNGQHAYHTPKELTEGCGSCRSGLRCKCVEDAFDITASAESGEPTKRPPSPSSLPLDANKRIRLEPNEEQDDLEIDFTTSRALLPFTSSDSNPTLTAIAIPPSEFCGFCQDGSACLCAELAAERQLQRTKEQESRLLSPPHESKHSSTLQVSDCAYTSTSNTCTGNPGSCTQCRINPESTLFCKSLAASRQTISSLPTLELPKESAPCPMGSSCCRVSSTLATTLNLPAPNPSNLRNGPTLSCADAFTTLSRHPAFGRASKDLGEWLPRLATRQEIGVYHSPVGINHSSTGVNHRLVGGEEIERREDSLAQAQGRTAFEIEAASVMGVLRFFDRRFGRDG